MREDSEMVPLQSWPDRELAVTTLPDGLTPERLRQWPVILRSDGLDETGMGHWLWYSY